MKQKTSNTIGRVSTWLTLVVAITIIGQSAWAAKAPPTLTVYDNSTTRVTDGTNSLYFTSSGYEYGDEVVLAPAYSAVLNDFKFEYYAMGVNTNAQMNLRIYANDGDLYGTNFNKPATLIYQSGFFDIADGQNDGFGTYEFNTANSGFSVAVPPRFTWTIEFTNVLTGTAGLALYNPPAVGGNYDQYWSTVQGTNDWVYRKPVGFDAASFGAVAKGTLTAGVTVHVVYSEGPGSCVLKPAWADGSDQTLYAVGKPLYAGGAYKVKVTPTKGLYWYSNAILSSAYSTTNYPGDLKAAKGQFTLVPDANSTLTIYAVTNRFIEAAGEYYGLFEAGAGISQDSAGYVSIKVTSKKTFSGKALFAGDKFGFAGAFALNGVGVTKAVMTSKIQTFSSVIQLQLNFDGTISGTISNQVTGVVSTLSAKQYKWSTTNPATDYVGQYTMVLSSSNSASAPNGYSVGTVTIDSLGVVQLKGTAADGYKVKQKTKLSPTGAWAMFAQYGKSSTKVLKGSMYGSLQVSTNGTERASGMNTWIRTAFAEAVPATYVSGFTNVSSVKLQKFTTGPAVVNLPGGAGTLKLTGIAGITSGIPVNESTSLGTMSANLPNTYGVKIALIQKDGSVKGSFLNPDNANAKVKFVGIAMQGDQAAYGYFILGSSAESVLISNP